MQRFELKDSPCTRCRRDESGHEPCDAFCKWAAYSWAKLQRDMAGKPMPDAGELCRRAGRLQKAGKERVR